MRTFLGIAFASVVAALISPWLHGVALALIEPEPFSLASLAIDAIASLLQTASYLLFFGLSWLILKTTGRLSWWMLGVLEGLLRCAVLGLAATLFQQHLIEAFRNVGLRIPLMMVLPLRDMITFNMYVVSLTQSPPPYRDSAAIGILTFVLAALVSGLAGGFVFRLATGRR